MYKKLKRYDAMVRLVAEHRPDILKETHQFLAQQLEMDGSLKEAEQHYAEAGEWLSAVNMCVLLTFPASIDISRRPAPMIQGLRKFDILGLSSRDHWRIPIL